MTKAKQLDRRAQDGFVTVQHPAAELGQGSRTVMPMILAEELDADWSMVRAATAPFDSAYANPGFVFNGVPRLVTADSTTTHGYWQVLREAGAQARRVLMRYERVARRREIRSSAA